MQPFDCLRQTHKIAKKLIGLLTGLALEFGTDNRCINRLLLIPNPNLRT